MAERNGPAARWWQHGRDATLNGERREVRQRWIGREDGGAAGNDGNGGGMETGNMLTVTGSTFSGNNSNRGAGGGIHNTGTLTVSGSTFNGRNISTFGAGGIHNSGTLTVNGSTFNNDSSGGAGGGIRNSGTLTVGGSTFSDNFGAYCGGGIANVFGSTTATVTNSTFTTNTANFGAGGGISNVTMLTVTNCTFSSNYGPDGGGIANINGGTLTVANSTFSANTTVITAAASINNGMLAVVGSTFTSNTANPATLNGGGIYDNGGTVSIGNTIFAGNTATNGPDLYRNTGTVTSRGHNLMGVSSDFTFAAAGDITGVTNPLVGPLADNGGPTQTRSLPRSVTPPIDAGDNSICAAAVTANPPGTAGKDQRGVNRPKGVACDIGAVEVLPAPTLAPTTYSMGSAGGVVTLTGTNLEASRPSRWAASRCPCSPRRRAGRSCRYRSRQQRRARCSPSS